MGPERHRGRHTRAGAAVTHTADIDRVRAERDADRFRVEDLCHEILERIGMDAYSEVLNFVSGIADGRVAAMQWQVIFQHLLVRRRVLCRTHLRDFYEVEKIAEKVVKKLGVQDPHLNWLLVYLYTNAMLSPKDSWEQEIWTRAVDTIKAWQTS